MVRNKLTLMLAVSSLSLALSSSYAFSQEAANTTEPAVKAKPAAAAETIIVTGSRIGKTTFTSNSPLTIITTESSVLAAEVDGVKSLQNSVAAAGSTQVNNSYGGFITEGGPGVNTIGLRGLGPGRTLVLMNGKRLPPAGVRGQVGAVDLNIIPEIAIDRREVLRDGASATYGSDAIGGVVNLITRKNVNGFEVNIEAAVPQNSGGETYSASFLWGKTKDNYNFMVSYDHFELKELNIGDRKFASCVQDYVFDPATGARADFIDPKTGKPFCRAGYQNNLAVPQGAALTGASFWISDPSVTTRTTGIRPDSTVVSGNTCRNAFGNLVLCNVLLTVPGFRRQFYPKAGTTGLPLELQSEQQTDFYKQQDIYSPVTRDTLYAKGSMDINFIEGAELFGEFLANKRNSTQDSNANDLFIVPSYYPGNPWGVNTIILPLIQTKAKQEVDTWQAVAGIRGKTNNGLNGFLKNGKWEISGQTSEALGTYTITDILDDRLNASFEYDTVTNTCPTPVLTGGTCLVIPWLSPRVISGGLNQAERDYLLTTDSGKTKYDQTIIEGYISGEIFKVPAGVVSANFGLQYREYSILDTPPAESLRGNTRIFSTSGITKGKDAVIEAMAEFEIPLIKGKPFFEDLSVNLQGRYTDYDSYDSNNTYKASLNWQMTSQVRLRGSVGTSYKAPELFNLFLADQTGFISQGNDPCAFWGESSNAKLRERCAAAGIAPDKTNGGNSIAVVASGGINNVANGFPQLKEETAENSSIGIIYRPTFADLQISLDYSKVDVTDQVASYGGANILGLCYAWPDDQYQFLCKNITRYPNNDPTRPSEVISVKNPYLNVSSQSQSEFALNIDYRKDFSFGRFSVNSETTFQTSLDSKLTPTSDTYDALGLIGYPAFVNRTQMQFRRKDWTYTWTTRAVGRTSDVRDFIDRYGSNPTSAGGVYQFNGFNEVTYKIHAETTIYHSMTVRYRSDKWTIVGGIDNIFDETPPSISSAPYGFPSLTSRLGTAALSSQYDLIGRSLFVNLTRRF